MKRDNWPVKDYGIRPAGKPTHCFYCGEAKGGVHKADCVIRQRTVIVKLTIEAVVEKPEHWTAEDIEFHLTESSSCQNNIVAMLNELEERLEQKGQCMCGLIDAEYVREATEQDEQSQFLFVKERES